MVDAKQGGAAPAGATAVMVNLTIVSQSPAGFLSAFRNGVAWPGNSSVNWERQGQVIANSAVVAVDGDGPLPRPGQPAHRCRHRRGGLLPLTATRAALTSCSGSRSNTP